MKISNPLSAFKALLTQRLSWFWLLVWLNLTTTALAATDCTNAAVVIPQAQCQALLDLYNSTNGPAWSDNATNNWNVTNTPCSWTGVTCFGGVVTEIYKGSNNLTGTLPSSLNGLTSLQSLVLDNNQLTGSLPDWSALTSLQTLDLSSNKLTGSIPDWSALTSLQGLFLYNNQLTGSIPDWSALTSLQDLSLNSNQLTGSIPDWSALTSLQALGLGYNQLTGSLPDWSALTSLQTLNLSYNQLTGSIPDWSALTSLQHLWLSDNQLTGSIPDWSALTSLQALYLDNNQLTGSIPDWSALTSLQTLWLSDNQLTGSIPDWSALTSLLRINLGYNQLTGSIPNLSGLTSLQYLGLYHNQLTGSIPNLSALTSLLRINLNNNQLTGSIPNLSALTSLQYLFLNNNQLTGSIPDWSALTSLQHLHLSNNQLTGSIPSMSELTSLQRLYLSVNQLTGTISSLPNSLGLATCNSSPGCGLFLDHNQLTGIIPDLSTTALAAPWVDLGCNQFTGETGGSATARDPDWASTQFCNAPAAPSGLIATPVSATQINLSWTDNSTNETGFKIESPAGALINTTAANVTSYSHTGLTCNTTHAYYLTATNAFGDSATIKTSATTASCAVPPPPPITSTDLTPYQDTGLAVRVTIEGSGQGRVVSTQGIGDQSIECSSANQPTGCQANFAPATYVTLTPIPAENSAFSGWGGHPECQKGTFLMTGGVLCTAYFRTLIHPVTLTVKGRGKIKGSHFDCQSDTTCTVHFREGTTLNWSVIRPRPSWTFAGWSGDCDSQGTVTVTKATQCQATFLDDPNIPNDRDGNGDGLKDAYQDNVVSIPDKLTNQYVTTEVDKNCIIDTMSSEMLDQVAAADPAYQFYQGLLYFDIVCPATQVTFYYHSIDKITRHFVMQKYGPKIPGDLSTLGWYLIPEAVFDTVKIGKQTVMRASYSLTDGELGDNTGVDGHIVDPVGVSWVK